MIHENVKHFAALWLAFATATPHVANAACTKSNLFGTWSAYVGSTNTQFDGYGKLTFTSTGALTINGASSFLEFKNGSKITFKSGDIKILTNCILYGNLTTTDDITFNVTQARLNSTKNISMGVYDRTDGDHGMFNLIR